MSKKSLRQIRRQEYKTDKELSYKQWAKSRDVAKRTEVKDLLPKDEIITLDHLTKPESDK